MSIDKIIKDLVKELFINRKNKKNNWSLGGKYIEIKEMNNDDTGEVGESLLDKVFSKKYKVFYEKAKTSDDKDWDIIIDKITIEVKTSTIGASSDTFQHEKFFPSRVYDAFIFLDFMPNDLYMTIAKKEDIVWENLTKRLVNNGKEKIFTGEYKFDLSLKVLKEGKTPKLKRMFVKKIEKEKDMLDLFEEFKKYFSKR